MLEFRDEPYRWFPPKSDGVWSWLCARWILRHNRWVHLGRAQRIERVAVAHADRVFRDREPGDRLLFLVNHPTHADAAVFLEAMRQLRVRVQMMAAYDVFLRSRVTRFVMQRMGAFSVDRDGSDRRPVQQAMATLQRGRYPLVIFPEGNVYLTNDRVTPFQDGAALIAVRAQEALTAEEGRDRGARVRVVPVAIRVTHATDARAAVAERFAGVADALEIDADLRADPLAALRAAGGAAVARNLKHRGLDAPPAAFGGDPPGVDGLAAAAAQAAAGVLDRLEPKLGLTPKPDATVTDRVRAARRAVHAVRSDPARAADHAAAHTWADEALLALRLDSYAVGYVHERPTLDRVAETVEKLEEDVFNHMPEPVAPRHATVSFGTPLDVRERLVAGRKRQVMADLTADAQAAVQALVDEANATNEHPGAEPF